MNRLSNSTKAAIIYEKGTPDVFKWEEVEVPNPVSYTHLRAHET